MKKMTEQRDEKGGVIPGFRAVKSSREWKATVAREIEGMTSREKIGYFRAAARRLGRGVVSVVAEDEAEYCERRRQGAGNH